MSYVALVTDRFDEIVHFYGEDLGFPLWIGGIVPTLVACDSTWVECGSRSSITSGSGNLWPWARRPIGFMS